MERERMRYIDAVRAQGKSLRASRTAVTERLQSLDLTPWRQRRLALVGMGASSNAISAALPGYWDAGLTAAAWAGSEFGLAGPAAGAEAVIAVSQTGKSAEVYAALQNTGLPRLVVTDVEDSPLTGLAEAVVPLSLLPDSNVRTIGYTGTIQALGLLRDCLLRDAVAGRGRAASADQTWEDAADELEARLPAAEELAEGLLPRLRGVTAFDVVGSGVHAGTAAQGALLLREVCKLPATGYETYQYLHGPIEAAEAGRVVVAIGGAREAKLAADLAAAGSTVLLVAAGPTAPAADTVSGGGAGIPATFAVTAADPLAQAVLAILPLQTITWQLAEDLSLPDGEFRYHQDDTKVG
jgi:glucosamine--fructose-6-phosphate aminotransferase (isomerizing)